jgi:hypothetical protein
MKAMCIQILEEKEEINNNCININKKNKIFLQN